MFEKKRVCKDDKAIAKNRTSCLFQFLQIMACGLSHALDTLGVCGGVILTGSITSTKGKLKFEKWI